MTPAINFLIEEKLEGEYYYWAQSYAEDEDNLPDGGWIAGVHVKLGSRTFELEVEVETEWCGDWSVRANLIAGYNILNVKETTQTI